jgi:hypothetical protein
VLLGVVITMVCSWRKIFLDDEEKECFDCDEETIYVAELVASLKHTECYRNVDTDCNVQWFEVDGAVSIYEILTKSGN